MSASPVFPIFQEAGSFACLGCVAAMIAEDRSLDNVARYAGHSGIHRPFRMAEVVGYLATRGYLLGAFAWKPLSLLPRILISCDRRSEALLIVANSYGNHAHAVYWTGDRVVDPEPKNQGKKLKDYLVLEWWPVHRVV